MSGNTFNGPQAMARINAITKFIAGNPGATSADVAKAIGSARGTACNYMAYLVECGTIRQSNAGHASSVMTQWELGASPNMVEKPDPYLVPRRPVLRTWPKDYPAPHELVAALFGLSDRAVGA